MERSNTSSSDDIKIFIRNGASGLFDDKCRLDKGLGGDAESNDNFLKVYTN